MPGLLSRIAVGLGKGAEVYGKLSLEKQREERLAKLQKSMANDNQEFQTSMAKDQQNFQTEMTEDKQDFTMGENAKDRANQLAKTANKGAKPATVKSTTIDDITGKEVITMSDGTQFEYEDSLDSYKKRGKGDISGNKDLMAEDTTWGVTQAEEAAGRLSGDATDFPYFKSERKAGIAAGQFRNNARVQGPKALREFDTKFKSQGFSYIAELAGSEVPETTEKPVVTEKMSPKKEQVSLMKVFEMFKDRDPKVVAQQLIDDPTVPEYMKKDAKAYLSK